LSRRNLEQKKHPFILYQYTQQQKNKDEKKWAQSI